MILPLMLVAVPRRGATLAVEELYRLAHSHGSLLLRLYMPLWRRDVQPGVASCVPGRCFSSPHSLMREHHSFSPRNYDG